MASTTKILIISEQLLNEKALLSMLKKLKLDITRVNSYKQALESLSGSIFDIVICDIDMPKINATLLRKNPWCSYLITLTCDRPLKL